MKGQNAERGYLDAKGMGVDHEIVESLEDRVVVAGLVAVADLGGLEVGEWVDVRALGKSHNQRPRTRI